MKYQPKNIVSCTVGTLPPFYPCLVGLVCFAFCSMVQKRHSLPPGRCDAEILPQIAKAVYPY